MQLNGRLLLLQKVLTYIVTFTAARVGEKVRIHGVLTCGGDSVVGARLKLFDGAGLKDDGTMVNYEDEFLFQTKNIDPSKLYLMIDHHCDGGVLHKNCWRRDLMSFLELVDENIIYHIGLIDLQSTNVSHPQVLHSIKSHSGCKCYRNNLFRQKSPSCRKFVSERREQN